MWCRFHISDTVHLPSVLADSVVARTSVALQEEEGPSVASDASASDQEQTSMRCRVPDLPPRYRPSVIDFDTVLGFLEISPNNQDWTRRRTPWIWYAAPQVSALYPGTYFGRESSGKSDINKDVGLRVLVQGYNFRRLQVNRQLHCRWFFAGDRLSGGSGTAAPELAKAEYLSPNELRCLLDRRPGASGSNNATSTFASSVENASPQLQPGILEHASSTRSHRLEVAMTTNSFSNSRKSLLVEEELLVADHHTRDVSTGQDRATDPLQDGFALDGELTSPWVSFSALEFTSFDRDNDGGHARCPHTGGCHFGLRGWNLWNSQLVHELRRQKVLGRGLQAGWIRGFLFGWSRVGRQEVGLPAGGVPGSDPKDYDAAVAGSFAEEGHTRCGFVFGRLDTDDLPSQTAGGHFAESAWRDEVKTARASIAQQRRKSALRELVRLQLEGWGGLRSQGVIFSHTNVGAQTRRNVAFSALDALRRGMMRTREIDRRAATFLRALAVICNAAVNQNLMRGANPMCESASGYFVASMKVYTSLAAPVRLAPQQARSLSELSVLRGGNRDSVHGWVARATSPPRVGFERQSKQFESGPDRLFVFVGDTIVQARHWGDLPSGRLRARWRNLASFRMPPVAHRRPVSENVEIEATRDGQHRSNGLLTAARPTSQGATTRLMVTYEKVDLGTFYRPLLGNGSAQPAGRGHFAEGGLNTNFSEWDASPARAIRCAAGTYQNFTERGDCRPCPEGTFCGLEGQRLPRLCSTGLICWGGKGFCACAPPLEKVTLPPGAASAPQVAHGRGCSSRDHGKTQVWP
jgi:hypothetical protein